MAWYTTGTIAVSGTTVTGTGTNWTDNKMGVGPGQALLIPGAGTVRMYEIASVTSANKLTLKTSAGTIAAGQAYAILSFYTDSVPDFARRLAAQLSYYQSQMDGWQEIMTGAGSITLTAPDGTSVTVSSFAKLTSDVADKVDKTTLNDLGIGIRLPGNSNPFDWQQADFLTGQTITSPSQYWVNYPTELQSLVDHSGGYYLNVEAASGTTVILEIQPSFATTSYQLRYWVRMTGEKGSRTFSARKYFMDNDVIPIGNGGTGATSAASARTKLGLGDAATATLQSGATDNGGGKVLTVGAFGLGGIAELNPLDLAYYSGFMQDSIGTSTGVPASGAGLQSSYGPNRRMQLWVSRAGALSVRFIDSTATSWYEAWTTKNTTKGSNGVLSAASPVCRIVKSQEESQRTDMDEDSFEWCGCGTANDEARGITISRLDVGVYKITGSLGFAKEGWYLMPPRDPAGSGDLGIAEGEQTESGAITIRLYKRKYMLNDDGEIELTKGIAIDVPANSWIDVRMNMPEKEVTEPQE